MMSIQPNRCLRQYKTISGEKREVFQLSPARLFYIGHLNGCGPGLPKKSEPQSPLNINIVARGYTSAKATAALQNNSSPPRGSFHSGIASPFRHSQRHFLQAYKKIPALASAKRLEVFHISSIKRLRPG
jgi:hypothetical protein